MDEYNEIVEWYKSTLIFKLSQIGFALNCNLLFSDRLSLLSLNKCFELIKYIYDRENQILIQKHETSIEILKSELVSIEDNISIRRIIILTLKKIKKKIRIN